MTRRPELRREIEALRERISALSAAILRIRAGLDLPTVLGEGLERARGLPPAMGGREAV